MQSQRRRSSVMDYEQSIMFGQYREKLANFALIQSQKANQLREERQKQGKYKPIQSKFGGPVFKKIGFIFEKGGDWVLLALVAIIIAILSFLMDIIIHLCFNLRDWLVANVSDQLIHKYLIWIGLALVLIMFAAILVRYISPQAAGSGVGEMKVVLRGVVLKEYLSFKTLVAKLIAVACAVGVASTFAAPVGGVLYSIEIVAVFYSVKSYWMGFFAATIGALFWRLLTVWFQLEDNITHIFKTDFRKEYPYETLELFSFAFLGVLSGLSAFVFVTLQRNIVLFNRRRTAYHMILQKYPLIYPVIVTTLIFLISFPPALGQFYASWLSSEQSMHQLFSNYSWGDIAEKVDRDDIIDNWRTSSTSIYTNTFLFFAMNLIIIALGSTMPIPLGLIVPSFKIGAGLGRFYGEWMAYLFPKGINPFYDRTLLPLIPGAYAVAGSAAFAGANTGAVSSAVIAFEMTGQLTHLLPVLVATIVATLVAQRLGPSIYDSLITLKKLPFLPPLIQSGSSGHRIFVEDFMEKDLLYVWEGCTYRYLRHLLSSKRHLNVYPYVKSPETMILLGTVERNELQNLLENHLSKDRMIDDLKNKPTLAQGLNKPSPSCPIHGQQQQQQQQPHQRFQVATIPENEVLEITTVGKHVWEENQLEQVVDFSLCPVDPAPFQLVEGTSLVKAHNLFTLLCLQLAYVTVLGRLIGVVTLKEIRESIEKMHSGELPHKKNHNKPESEPLNK